jgi:hypothetical protein
LSFSLFIYHISHEYFGGCPFVGHDISLDTSFGCHYSGRSIVRAYPKTPLSLREMARVRVDLQIYVAI